MAQQGIHDIIMRVISSYMKWCKEFLVLLIQMCTFAYKSFHNLLPFWIGWTYSTVLEKVIVQYEQHCNILHTSYTNSKHLQQWDKNTAVSLITPYINLCRGWWLNSPGSKYDPVASPCEHYNGHLGFIKHRKFLVQLSNYQFLKLSWWLVSRLYCLLATIIPNKNLTTNSGCLLSFKHFHLQAGTQNVYLFIVNFKTGHSVQRILHISIQDYCDA